MSTCRKGTKKKPERGYWVASRHYFKRQKQNKTNTQTTKPPQQWCVWWVHRTTVSTHTWTIKVKEEAGKCNMKLLASQNMTLLWSKVNQGSNIKQKQSLLQSSQTRERPLTPSLGPYNGHGGRGSLKSKHCWQGRNKKETKASKSAYRQASTQVSKNQWTRWQCSQIKKQTSKTASEKAINTGVKHANKQWSKQT